MSNREISEIVGECAGAVSVCWSDINKAGEFDSSQASKFVDDALAEIQAAGYRKPRTITTAEELDALPVGSVIRTSGHEDHFDPRVAVKTGFWKSESEWEVADADDFCLDSGELDDLPATVLHDPSTP